MTYRSKRTPAWVGVVADVEDTTNLELTFDEVKNLLFMFGRYPTPDAMCGNEIEIWQIGAVGKLLKGIVKQFSSANHAKFLGKS